jgi:2-polyprenyl-3-methyl-5-hydroxy-6-metoxy-1,4-benzoquinol methylase
MINQTDVALAGSPRWPEWACPEHRVTLVQENDSLVCPVGCRHPVRGSIPRFVPGSAYASAFGLQWLRYRRTQLDSHTGVPVTARRMQRCFGTEAWERLRDQHVLEAGCGAGRFTEVLLQQGARVTSVDLSDAVDANQQNFPQGPAHRIAQADILKLPFAPCQFDVVFCLGVIQHTPSPEATIAALYDNVRPGGLLVIDHYAPTLSWYTKTAPLFRMVLKRLSPEAGLRATDAIVHALLPLHRSVRNWYLGQALLSRISPVICYYHGIPDLGDASQREWALLDTHDSLTDWYKHFRSERQIQQTLDRLGVVETCCADRGSNVEARGRRPG